jgi:hypothetical protein
MLFGGWECDTGIAMLQIFLCKSKGTAGVDQAKVQQEILDVIFKDGKRSGTVWIATLLQVFMLGGLFVLTRLGFCTCPF